MSTTERLLEVPLIRKLFTHSGPNEGTGGNLFILTVNGKSIYQLLSCNSFPEKRNPAPIIVPHIHLYLIHLMQNHMAITDSWYFKSLCQPHIPCSRSQIELIDMQIFGSFDSDRNIQYIYVFHGGWWKQSSFCRKDQRAHKFHRNWKSYYKM